MQLGGDILFLPQHVERIPNRYTIVPAPLGIEPNTVKYQSANTGDSLELTTTIFGAMNDHHKFNM